MRGMGAYPLKRGSVDFGAVRETLKRLKNGSPVVIFPQGTRKSRPDDKDAEAGIGFMAVKSQSPVIPVYIEGTQHVLPRGKRILRRHPVVLRVGKPLYFLKNESYHAMARRVIDAIFALA